MRADDERRVPVPAQRRIALRRFRHDVDALAGAFVESHDAGVLTGGVDRVGILRVDTRIEAVAAVGDETIGVGQHRVLGARGAADAVVVLRAAIDVVERRVFIHRHVVELAGREVFFEDPGAGAVEALIQAAVASHHIVIVVLRVHPDIVIVDVLVARAELAGGAAAIVGNRNVDAHDVDALFVRRIHHHLGVILRLLIGVVPPLPGDAVIHGAVEAAVAVAFHFRVNHLGVGGRVVQADAAQTDLALSLRESALHFRPCLAGVNGAPQGAAGAAVNDSEIGALALMRGCQQHIRILGIHHHVGAAGVFVHLDEALRPGLAAVGGLVEAAIAAALPQGALRRHVDHVGIARVHDDAGDVFGRLQSHVVECSAAVLALIDAIAVGRCALVVVLTGAHPHNRRILGIDGDPADGKRSIVVEHGCPGGPVVFGHKDVARGQRDHIVAGIVGEHGDLQDAAGDHGGADLARPQTGEGAGVDGVLIVAAAAASALRSFVLREGRKRNTQ